MNIVADQLRDEIERLRALLRHPTVVRHVPPIDTYSSKGLCPICLEPLEYANELVNGQNVMQGGPMGCGSCGWVEPNLTESERDWNRAIRKALEPSVLVRCVLLSDRICAKYKPGEDPGYPEQALHLIADNFVKQKRPMVVYPGRNSHDTVGDVRALSVNRFNDHVCLFADVHLLAPLPPDSLIACSVMISKWPCSEPIPNGDHMQILMREELSIASVYACLAGDHLHPEARKYGLRPINEHL